VWIGLQIGGLSTLPLLNHFLLTALVQFPELDGASREALHSNFFLLNEINASFHFFQK
jgi:hypothetical protein